MALKKACGAKAPQWQGYGGKAAACQENPAQNGLPGLATAPQGHAIVNPTICPGTPP